ncbi:TPA: type II toxin-antitoxin system RelE/ParE family toxin [Klebsiella variicola subsp. variicola]|nr:type II toxin-antitoxin system RelE/ParE family toxin [Klebsiella variicola subsp. variicola]
MLKSIANFRTKWLEDYFLYGTSCRMIPSEIEASLSRKLDIINAASDYRDLRSPPGNNFESLEPPLDGWFSIRVSKKYRLIFMWVDGKATDLYLDPHSYKSHK